MTATQLNLAWMLSTFVLAAQETAKGAYIVLDMAVPEVQDLVNRKYIKLNKKLHSDGNSVAAVAVKGAYAEDLIADLGLGYDESIGHVPVELRKPLEQATTEVAAQPEAAPAINVVDATVTEQAAPTFHGDAAQSANAAVAPQVVEVVERRGKETAIALGVSYRPQTNNLAQRAPQEEAYPYAEIVALKVAHPNETPSFHVVGKESKDVSGMIRRHAKRYEESHGVTFRAQKVGADDINGAGVRVFALSLAEAPARPNRKKGAEDVGAAAAPQVPQPQ